MPTIALFRGISIYMFTEIGQPHFMPHFHAYYGEYAASIAIDPPVLLEGTLPRRQMRIVLAWAELHQEELAANWERVQNGHSPIRIEGI
jgi:hypothetical protein